MWRLEKPKQQAPNWLAHVVDYREAFSHTGFFLPIPVIPQAMSFTNSFCPSHSQEEQFSWNAERTGVGFLQ